MLRGTSLALAALAGVALAVTPAASAPVRTAKATYTGGLGAANHTSTLYVPGGGEIGSATLWPVRGERFVRLTVTDSSGLPTRFAVWQNVDHSDESPDAVLGEFCGSTPPLRLRSDVGELTIFPKTAEPCGSGVGVATTGVVTARFTR